MKDLGDYSRSQIEYLIYEYIFSERDRAILKRRLLDGIVYDKLAEEFDLSPDHIRKIVYKSEEKLFKKLGK